MTYKAKKKYKKVIFKLSLKQYKVITRFCKSKKMTPNKLFKKAIKDYIVHNYDFNDNDYHISENQLALFDLDDAIDENDADLSDNDDADEEKDEEEDIPGSQKKLF